MIRSILFLVAVLLLTSIGFSQSETYYMNDWTASSQWNYNPALQSKSKVFLYVPVLAGVNFNAGHTGFTFNDAITDNQVNISSLIDNLEQENHLLFKSRIDLFGIGLKFGNVQLRAGAQGVTDTRLTYSKEFLELLWKGNGHPDLIGRRLNMDGTAVNTNAYLSYFFGGSASLMDNKLNIGLNAKLYSGAGSVFTEQSSFGLTTSATDYSITADGSFDVRSSGVSVDSIDASTFTPLSAGGNSGFGLDLGVTYAPTEKLTVEVSVLDMGQITWTENVENYQLTDTEITYSGLELNQFVSEPDSAESTIQQFADSLIDSFTPSENSDEYSTAMNYQFFLRGAYDINKNNEVSAFFSQQKSFGVNFNNVGVLYAHNFGKILKLRTGLQLFRTKDLMIPFGLVLHAGPVELGIHTDNALAVVAPTRTKNLSGMFSIGFIFGKEKEAPVKE